METFSVKAALHSTVGTRVSVCGWVKTIREASRGTVAFIALGDGSCIESLQVVVLDTKKFSASSAISTGTSISVTGEIVASEGTKQHVELKLSQDEDELKLLGACDPEKYPIGKSSYTIEYLRNYPHLKFRSQYHYCIAKVRSSAAFAVNSYYHSNGYFYIHTPLITGSDCEGSGELFSVYSDEELQGCKKKVGYPQQTFFNGPAFLTCSGQLSVEGAACALTKTYTFSPVFRAEKSHTSKHLSEFWMIEPEIAFIDFDKLIDIVTETIKYCVKYVLDYCKDEILWLQAYLKSSDNMPPSSDKDDDHWLEGRLKYLLESEPVKITYTDAMDKIREHFRMTGKSEKDIEEARYGSDLSSEMEQVLVNYVYPMRMVYVTHWPADLKAFYMKKETKHCKEVLAMDCLLPQVGEVAGGSMREDDEEVLIQSIKACGLKMSEYESYIDLRRFGTVPHGGFGIGFDRLISYIAGIKNIRDTIPYPRAPGSIFG